MVRSLTLLVGVLAFTSVGADVDIQADETTLLQGLVSHRGRPTPQLLEVPVPDRFPPRPSPHKPKPRPLPQKPRPKRTHLMEVPVPDQLPAKFATRVNVWANANPGAARVVREATRQQIMQALLDADGGDVEAAVERFPGAAQAIRQFIQNVDGQDANPDKFSRISGFLHEIRGAISVPEIPEQAPGRFADEIREWANANPDAAKVVREATHRQILQALLDAEKHDVERAVGRFPGAAQAIRQFIQNIDREDVEAASERFPGAAEAIRQYASSHPTDSRRVARFIMEIRQSGTTSLLQQQSGWCSGGGVDVANWLCDIFPPWKSWEEREREAQEREQERLDQCEEDGFPNCEGRFDDLEFDVGNVR